VLNTAVRLPIAIVGAPREATRMAADLRRIVDGV
jgi:hypothetical protein